MARESDAVAALSALIPPSAALTPAAIAPLRELYDAVGPAFPRDMRATPVDSKLPGSPKVLHFSYDEGHAGRFSVPDSDGGSVAVDFVMDTSNPPEYVMKNLAFRAVGDKPFSAEDEVVIFIPGLNTVHEPMQGETTTIDRLIHYVKVLGTVPMAQIHMGTSFDQGDATIDTSNSPKLRELLTSDKLPTSVRPAHVGDGKLVFNARQLDNVQVTLSQYNAIDTPVKRSIRTLLATTEIRGAKPFVLFTYSRGSIECEAALRQYVKTATGTKAEIEKRLREKVTVVTIGSASHNYPDGPAYIHMASWTDPLSTADGVTATNNAEGGGKDAVFLNCPSPYHPDAFDNHNFGAVTAQFLSMVIAKSQATGVRDLWEKAQRSEMMVPGDLDAMVRATIQLTRGYEWIWEPADAWKDIPMGALPTFEGAEALLRERMGAKYVDMIKRSFPRN